MRLFELVSELHPDALLPWGIGAQIHGYGTAGDPEPLGSLVFSIPPFSPQHYNLNTLGYRLLSIPSRSFIIFVLSEFVNEDRYDYEESTL